MKLIQQWYCKVCQRVRERAAFPPHIDANTPCIDCQSAKRKPGQSSTDAAAGTDNQPVYVRRKGQRSPKGPNRSWPTE